MITGQARPNPTCQQTGPDRIPCGMEGLAGLLTHGSGPTWIRPIDMPTAYCRAHKITARQKQRTKKAKMNLQKQVNMNGLLWGHRPPKTSMKGRIHFTLD